MRPAAGRGNHPYILGHWAFRRVINVGRSLVPKILAPCKGDRLRIRRPGEVADIETVVACVRCDLTRFRAIEGVCYPDITAALRVEHPRHGCARGRGHQVERKWRLHHIVECKGRWIGSPSLRYEEGCAGCCRAPEPQLFQTEVNHVFSLVTIQNLVSKAKTMRSIFGQTRAVDASNYCPDVFRYFAGSVTPGRS